MFRAMRLSCGSECGGEDLEWRMKGVSGARPAVQTVGNGVKFVLTVDRKVGAFGQILAQQSVGVFTSSALPWAVRVEVAPLVRTVRSRL
ncbi:hypothetical protein BSFA1_77180 (plasmid) [Burkholderia sp. SFA1]|nr:hypothetical protein BSFA1_77180 [Burkholderia sp. SFA1]